MNILLVMPKLRPYGQWYPFPLGLGYISAALKAAGHTVHGLNCNLSPASNRELVEEAVGRLQPDVCASGSLSVMLSQMQEIFDAARRIKPDIVNIAGGGVVSGDPEVSPKVMDIDYGVIDEGEVTVVDLCRTLETGGAVGGVPGIVYTRDGVVLRTPARPLIADLGAVAWADYEGFGYNRSFELPNVRNEWLHHIPEKPRMLEMISSRSCPFRCTFCFHPTGKTYRERPLDDFFAELDMLVARYQINSILLHDELFSLKKARILEFCDRIEPYGLRWIVSLHINSVDERVLKRMKAAGCVYISYGIESMSQDVLVSMKKKTKVERIDRALALTYENKIGIQGNIIFCDSAETLETANTSMHWWARHRQYMINLSTLQIYPGSPDYHAAIQRNMIPNREDFIKNNRFCSLNVSNISDSDISIMLSRLFVVDQTLLHLAPVLKFDNNNARHEVHGDCFTVAWRCPRCGHVSEYTGIYLSTVLKYILLVSCRGCTARFHVPNHYCLSYVDHLERHFKHEYESQTRRGEALLREGQVKEGVTLLKETSEKFLWSARPALALAAYYSGLASGCWERGENQGARVNLFLVINWLGAALTRQPFNSDSHVAYANALVLERTLGMARLHYEQALALEPGNAAAAEGLKTLENPQWSKEERTRYFAATRGPGP